MIPWNEKVPTLSIHPDAASRDDIAKLATKLMEANHQLDNARDCLWGEKAGYVKELEIALRKYGDHLGTCYKNLKIGKCNCGFEQALKGGDR